MHSSGPVQGYCFASKAATPAARRLRGLGRDPCRRPSVHTSRPSRRIAVLPRDGEHYVLLGLNLTFRESLDLCPRSSVEVATIFALPFLPVWRACLSARWPFLETFNLI